MTTSADFCSLMASFPTGVAILTTFAPDGAARGMTCSSVCSVTLTPPTLLVCVRRGSPTLDCILLRCTFAVNLLHNAAAATARLFASGAPDRFELVRWNTDTDIDTDDTAGTDTDPAGPQLTDAAHAIAHCRVSHTQPIGDHVVVFGEVYRVRRHPAGRRPLLYGMRHYAAWPASSAIPTS